MSSLEQAVPETLKRTPKWVRPALLITILGGLFIAGKYTGIIDELSIEGLRTKVESTGPLGFFFYVAIFCVGLLLYMPGTLFVAAGILAYGKLLGFLLAGIGSLVSISVSFFLVRAVGGQAFAEIKKPLVKKILGKLEERPITTIAILRCILWLNPALNYTLALSSVRYRDYLLGSVIGLIPPLLAAALAIDWIVANLVN
jgi:uncharacterized membrane protein YdjX (TVP38/TMEM64 family)